MPTLYETLGVDKSASTSEIKRAYRRRASKAHPDKAGGDGSAMAALNKAHEVLTDPVRRLNYDASGRDCEPPPLHEAAQNMLSTFFAEGLSNDEVNDVTVYVRGRLDSVVQGATTAAADARMKIKRFEKKRARITVKSGTNLVHHLIDDVLRRLAAETQNADQAIAVANLATEQLAEYQFEPETVAPGTFQGVSYSTIRFTA